MDLNWMTINDSFPTFKGDEPVDKKIKMLHDYLFKLTDQLRFTLENLDVGNFNADALEKLKADTTQNVQQALDTIQKDMRCTNEGIKMGTAGRRIDIIGDVYINGVLYK